VEQKIPFWSRLPARVDMPHQDFLHKDAETTLCEHYLAAGAICRLSTNSQHVLNAAGLPLRPARLR